MKAWNWSSTAPGIASRAIPNALSSTYSAMNSTASSRGTSAAAARIPASSPRYGGRRAWRRRSPIPEITKPLPETDEIEFERYELRSGPAYCFTPDRRDFFKLLGGGIILFLALVPESEAQEGRSEER